MCLCPPSLAALSCLSQSGGISLFQGERQGLLQHSSTASGISSVLDPVLEPTLFCLGSDPQESSPFAWLPNQGPSEAAEAPHGLFMHSFNKQLSCQVLGKQPVQQSQSLLHSGGLEAPGKMSVEASQPQLHRGTTWGAQEIKILMPGSHPQRF